MRHRNLWQSYKDYLGYCWSLLVIAVKAEEVLGSHMCFWNTNPEHSESQRGTSLPWISRLTEMPWNSLEECARSNGVQHLLTDECRKDGSRGPSLFLGGCCIFYKMEINNNSCLTNCLSSRRHKNWKLLRDRLWWKNIYSLWHNCDF